MTKIGYPACFYKENEYSYSIVFPDLGYLSTFGESLDEAFFMAADALAGYIIASLEDGDFIPKPSSIEDISLDQDFTFESGFVKLIVVDIDEYSKTHSQNRNQP